MATQFLRKAAVAARYGITQRTLERWVKDARLPQPTYRGKIPLWREADLEANDRAAAAAPRPKRDDAAAKTEAAA
jgi:predicted DNA-binding transcriptional regulator AlpA